MQLALAIIHLWLLFLQLKLTKAKKEPALQVLLLHRLPI